MTISVRPTTLAEGSQLLRPLAVAFGFDVTPERLDRFQAIPELMMRLGAFDGDELVGSAGSWSFAMTTPGGVPVDVEGLTIVGVLTTRFRFPRLADAGRVVEHTKGALFRADALFRSARAPWCPEIF